MYQALLTANKQYIDSIAREVAEKLSSQCIFTNEETARVSYMLIEKMFIDHLNYHMVMDFNKEKQKHFPEKEPVVW